MRSIRPFLFASLIASFAVAAPLAACGGGDDGGTTDDNNDVTPEGDHYKSVASQVEVPSKASEPKMFSLDLDADGLVDNQLGVALVTLGAALSNQTVAKDAVDKAVAQGSIILLADVQTTAFDNASAAGITVSLGENPMPMPCTNPDDLTTCGKHLLGTGSFDIKAGNTNTLTGVIAGGTMTAGPGKVTLQIALGDAPISLDLIGARIEATGITADGIASAKVAGAVLETDFDGKVLPGIKTSVIDAQLAEANCNPEGDRQMDCGCMVGSSGLSIINLLDKQPAATGTLKAGDCKVTIEEIKTNPTLAPLIQPDVALDPTTGAPTSGAKNALSIGVRVKTVKATF